MNLFDKICAVTAFALGVTLMILGVFGVFIGARAWFVLPPILGVLPAFVGWGILRAVYFAWQYERPEGPRPLTPVNPLPTGPPPVVGE